MATFKKDKPDAAGFYTAVPAPTVRENEMTVVNLGGKKIILTRWAERLAAFDHACPHASADLSKGELHRGRIICPDHEYKFDVGNGRILYPPDETYCLKRYPVKEENGHVKVKV